MKNRELKDRSLFNSIASDYSKKDTTESTSIVRRFELVSCIKESLGQKNNIGRIVEIGCGIGAPAQYLHGMYDEYIGLDYSDEFVDIAKKLHADKDNVSFICQNIKDCNLDDSADVVLAVGVLHHIDDIDIALQAITKILKPGGIFIAIEPQSANPIISFTRWVRKKIDSSYSSDQIFFKKQELETLFSRNGFLDIGFAYKGFLSPPFGEVIMKPEALFVRLNRLLIFLDKTLDKILPKSLKFISWGCVISGKKIK